MALHVFLCMQCIQVHVGGDLKAHIQNNLHSTIMVLLLLSTTANLEP